LLARNLLFIVVLKKVGTYFSLRIVAGWIELLLFLRFKKCLQGKYK
jgi:hypothetical protein